MVPESTVWLLPLPSKLAGSIGDFALELKLKALSLRQIVIINDFPAGDVLLIEGVVDLYLGAKCHHDMCNTIEVSKVLDDIVLPTLSLPVGVVLGSIVLEYLSRDDQLSHAFSYIEDPTKLICFGIASAICLFGFVFTMI
jgi:hypothetical protein